MAADDITDPSDFLPTALSSLSTVDSSLRCQICKDFLTNAVITSCSHTFCSLCIRRSLAAEGKCPACRTPDAESKLRRNNAAQEVVDAWASARGDVLEVAKKAMTPDEPHSARGSKRKRPTANVAGDEAEEGRPRTRAQRRRIDAKEASSQASTAQVIDLDSADEAEYSRSSQNQSPEESNPLPDDGLVPCPICKTRMKPDFVWSHLESCDGTKKSSPPPPLSNSRSTSTTTQPLLSSTKLSQTRIPPKDAPRQRLPQLNYSLSSDQKLRQKLNELGIPSWGRKELMVKRHTEWINLWNSECDAKHPRSKQELLKDLAGWEDSQGGRAREGAGSKIMKKEFDGAAWAKKNQSDFHSLIAQARACSKAAKQGRGHAKGDGQQVDGAQDRKGPEERGEKEGEDQEGGGKISTADGQQATAVPANDARAAVDNHDDDDDNDDDENDDEDDDGGDDSNHTPASAMSDSVLVRSDRPRKRAPALETTAAAATMHKPPSAPPLGRRRAALDAVDSPTRLPSLLPLSSPSSSSPLLSPSSSMYPKSNILDSIAAASSSRRNSAVLLQQQQQQQEPGQEEEEEEGREQHRGRMPADLADRVERETRRLSISGQSSGGGAATVTSPATMSKASSWPEVSMSSVEGQVTKRPMFALFSELSPDAD